MQFAVIAARRGTWPENVEVSVNPDRTEATQEVKHTGAGLTILNENTYRNISGGILQPTKIKLYTYTRDRVDVLG